jgi:hypothetical protein
MRTIVSLMVTSLVFVAIACYGWMHIRHTADSFNIQNAPITEDARQAETTYSEAQDAPQSVSFAGPLATYMSKQGPVAVEKVRAIAYRPTASDHVGGSVVGTSIPILNEKFHVSVIVDLPFDVPAHAATPKLRGNFRSFFQASGKPTSDTDADVEFHVLNDREFSNFLNGKPSEALLSADATHNQEVNASLPPTLNQPATYHMVFLNDSTKRKKVVQADFHIDF